MQPQSPCKDCQDRHMGCHSTCQLYIDYDVANKRYKEELNKMKTKEWGNITHAYVKALKKKGKK